MPWIALALFALWMIGDLGDGAHLLLTAAIGVVIVGLTGPAGRRLADEAERRMHA